MIIHVVRRDGTTFDVDLKGYEFSVIYSAECQKDDDIEVVAPPGENWEVTERDDSREYDYLGEDWEGSRHRKWAAILTLEEFEAFVDKCDIHAEDVETMGSIGAPGFGFGVVPAIAFDNHGGNYIQSAYVTPIPPDAPLPPSWQDVKDAIVERYKDGAPFPEWEDEEEDDVEPD